MSDVSPDQREGQPAPRTLLGRGSWAEAARIATLLRGETVGGALLLIATVIAMVWANSPASDSYFALAKLRDRSRGPAPHLPLGVWASDGLLAVFFFVVGLELKREFVAGDLRDPRRAALPILAAVGGMAVPALIYIVINFGTGDGALRGWAIPTATDIAFALAVLAVISTHLPTALRTFLLTLAVVDDLLAITIIAFFYTPSSPCWRCSRRSCRSGCSRSWSSIAIRSWWLLLPLAAVDMDPGAHVGRPRDRGRGPARLHRARWCGARQPAAPAPGPGLAEHFEHRIRPISAGFAVPVFAFFAAGVTIGGLSGLTESLTDRVALGIVAGLVIGKTVGIFGTT